MARKLYWVRWIAERWSVRSGDHTLSNHAVKADAIAAGVRVASSDAPSSLRICRKDGTIEDERTYGHDPYPPRG